MKFMTEALGIYYPYIIFQSAENKLAIHGKYKTRRFHQENIMKTITPQELSICLTRLKRAINCHSSNLPKNVFFFNALSFYLFMKDLPCHGKLTIDDIISRIEPYIPIRLTQETFDMFLDNILAAKNGEELSEELMLKAKGDFVYAVQAANTPETWATIVKTCESIRGMKESKSYSTLV